MSIPIRRIALGGGGAKGILHIGALQEIAKHQPLEFPDGIYGSSVGSIIASCIAFRIPLDGILKFIRAYSSIESIIPSKLDLQHISKMFSEKGVYTMETFETRMIELFQSNGISIADKTLNDAYMPLHIVATNITRGVPTVFSGNVPLLDAIKCSCCIPVLFRPIELYGQLYIDGDILTPCIASVAPADTFCISLNKKGKNSITPSILESMSPLEYISNVYSMAMRQFQKSQSTTTTIHLSYPLLYSDSDISEHDLDKIIQYASEDCRRFLATQRLA